MRSLWLGLLLVVSALSDVSGSRGAEAAPKSFIAGVAARDVTPKPGLAMAGYSARQGVSAGTRDPLQAKAIVLGDGRQSIAREPDGEFGLLVLDAFSSDAIPVHLLTTEAIDLYFKKMRPDGLLVVNATNRHVDLGRLAAGLARECDLVVAEWMGESLQEPSFKEGKLRARWLVMARHPRALAPLAVDPLWRRLRGPDDAPVWTDDFSNLLAVIDWWP